MPIPELRCPRCGGIWWQQEVAQVLEDSDARDDAPGVKEYHGPIARAVKQGSFTPLGAIATVLYLRVLYRCVDCSFPGDDTRDPVPVPKATP